jgi:hypothetical protein
MIIDNPPRHAPVSGAIVRGSPAFTMSSGSAPDHDIGTPRTGPVLVAYRQRSRIYWTLCPQRGHTIFSLSHAPYQPRSDDSYHISVVTSVAPCALRLGSEQNSSWCRHVPERWLIYPHDRCCTTTTVAVASTCRVRSIPEVLRHDS